MGNKIKINHCLFDKQVQNKIESITRGLHTFGNVEMTIYGRKYLENADGSVSVDGDICSYWGEAIDKYLKKDVENYIISTLEISGE